MATNPGDGFTSPFGDGDGGTQEVARTARGTDFTLDPAGQGRKVPVDPERIAPNRAQRMGKSEFNPDSVPQGGRVLMADPARAETNMTKAIGQGNRKPFKLTGGTPGPDSEVEGGSTEVGGLP